MSCWPAPPPRGCSHADYGKLNAISDHRAKLSIIEPHWDYVLRLIGSLKLGRVPATGIMRTLQVGEKATPLVALAVAEIGRIDKTIHTLNFSTTKAGGAVRWCN